MSHRASASQLQRRIAEVADPGTKTWFENYLKGVIDYRGVKTPEVSKLLKAWYRDASIGELPAPERLKLGRQLGESRFAEDKFAGFLLWAHELKQGQKPPDVLDEVEALFEDGHVWDWSTSDWLCVRVTGECLAKGDAKTARRIEGWSKAKDLWQRRSSIVSFRAVLEHPRHHDALRRLVKRLVKEDARFIQTGVGWTLADLSRRFPDLAAELFESHFEQLSREVIDRHTKHLPLHARYKQAKRAGARVRI